VTVLRAVLCATLLLSLGACVSLFPKTTPAQLYRFGVASAPAQAPGASAVFDVSSMPTGFAHAAEGDRILTVNGTEAAYIAQARWDAPASILFDEAETQVFEGSGGPVRLLGHGDPASARFSLKLDVQTFEARYTGSAKSAPTVVVTVHALLVSTLDRKVVGDQIFVSQAPASDDRVGAIVQAFDAATTDVLNQIVGWTGREGASGA
jgi:cholesterol transport system auxiliary component